MLPIDEKHNYTKSYCETLLKHILGGRAAEQIVFNQYTTGAGNDIEKATQLARKMVCEWGMSDELGPITFGKKNEEIFLGREIAQHRDFSEKTAIKIDAEVRHIVTEAEKESVRLLKENIKELEKLAETLLEKEILTSDEIDKIINKKNITKKRSPKKAKSKTSKK